MTFYLADKEISSIQWNYDSYLVDTKDENILTLKNLNYPVEELFGRMYFKSLYDKVHNDGFTILQSWDGRHRSSKSTTSAVEGYILDETFFPNLEDRIIQTHEQFFDSLEWIMKNEVVGAYLQVDEAGNSMGSTDWAESWAKDLSKCMQMLGYLLPIISFTSPRRDFVMSKLRGMMHIHNVVKRPSTTFSYVYPYNLVQDSISGREYTPHPRISYLSQTYVLDRVKVTKPPKFLIEAYDSIAGVSKDQIIKTFIENSRDKPQEKKVPLDIDAAAKTICQTPLAFQSLDSKRKMLSLDLIRYHFDKFTEGGVTLHQTKTIRQKAMQLIAEKKKIEEEKKA